MPNKSKILLFEKEAAFADDVRQTLAGFGYSHLTVVCAGDQLLEAALEVSPDLILVGISLAGWLDCIEAVEAVGTSLKIPLIYLSCHAYADLFCRSQITNPYAFLLKPFNSIQLSYAIEVALTKHNLEKYTGKCASSYRSIFELGGSAMIVLDESGTVIMANEEFESLSGYSREMIIGSKSWNDFFFDQMSAIIEDSDTSKSRTTDAPRSDLPVLFVGNGDCSKSVHLKVKQLNGLNQYIASMFDVSEIKGAENEIHTLNSGLMKINAELRREINERHSYEKVLLHQANHDSLTGLPNRQLLFDRLKQAIAYVDRNSSMLALMLIDLDSFKLVNDTMGHVAGDALLKGVAGRLQACLRKYDTVARFGGDEFVIIANDMPDIHDIVGFADKILDSFQQPFDVLGKPVCVSASIGLAIYPIQSRGPDCLLKMADSAMYQAKSEGGNDYKIFTESMSLKLDRRVLMENKLRAALDREEYLAHYQPRIDVATRKIIGMEALMRWQPIDEPMGYPADFFSILEESGLIVSVGEWLLEKICHQNKAWHDAGLPPLRVAVNVSERQFGQDDFTDGISRALSKSRLDPRFLEIELPEQIVMNNVVESVSRLKKLKSTGVTISLDNFGTGYSSLTQLNRLPIDDIQIDKSLVNGIFADDDDAKVVSAIISMGHSLGKNMIAEGVESEEQFMFLAQRRCKEMQGHFFSRPLTPIEFEKLARKYTL